MKIEKKILPEYFQNIVDGDKNFELRLADWKCEKGDILVLKEWNPKTREYTGRVIEKTVGYVLRTKDVNFWDRGEVEKYGYQIISLK